MFKQAIVRLPGKSVVNGISSASQGKPDYVKLIEQHTRYITALENCGLEVHFLDADEKHPDSVFVEDVALMLPDCAIITRPGSIRRRGETSGLSQIFKKYYKNIESITPPATLDAGDVMCVGNHYYIGLSERTNEAGAIQLIELLKMWGFTGSMIILTDMLHLKTGVSYIENKTILVTGSLKQNQFFSPYNQIHVDDDESYAANSLWINGTVLVPSGYPKTKHSIEKAGYKTIELDMSEFRKLDGGLSCLSLRF
nr:N(G),N(G)-dimethylarginine dimethylaminohydrolase [Bacteroidota bacterium]